jgi:signal peptidase
MKAKHSVAKTKNTRAFGLGSFLFGALLVLGLTGPLILSTTAGLGFTTVLTGSMKPVLNPGDLAITKLTPASKIEVGDLVSLVDTDSFQKFMHRVTDIEVTGENVLLITKGDNNPVKDMEASVVPISSFVPKQIATLSYLGSALKFIETPAGALLFTGILILGVGGIALTGQRKNNLKEITNE